MAKVHIVGAGPGDPELLTVKACRVLAQADIVFYDRLVSADVLAAANPAAEFVYAGKDHGDQEVVQPWIHDRLLEYARSGKSVVRLHGGDPCIFGRGAEEWQFLAENGFEVEIIPGVSSATALPALAGIPLTLRGVSRSFAVITGSCRSDESTDWSRYTAVDTLVLLMAVRRRADIASELILAGRPADQPAAFIERGATPAERVVETTLEEIAGAGVEVESPAVLIVGEVVRLRRLLAGELEAVVSAEVC
jgi:uroporphyrin-III C-methyltransferase